MKYLFLILLSLSVHAGECEQDLLLSLSKLETQLIKAQKSDEVITYEVICKIRELYFLSACIRMRQERGEK